MSLFKLKPGGIIMINAKKKNLIRHISVIMVFICLISIIPLNLSLASTLTIYNLTEHKQLNNKLLDINNVSLSQLQSIKEKKFIWVQDDVLSKKDVQQTLIEELNKGSEIYFIQKGINLSQITKYLELDNIVNFNLPAPKMDLKNAPKELQDQIKTGKNVIIREPRKNNVTAILGIKKVNDSYASSEIAFESVTDDIITKYLIKKTLSGELDTSLQYGKTSKYKGSVLPVSINYNKAEASEDWPVAWTHSRTDVYSNEELAWNITLYRHPDNPNNNYQKIYGETVFMDITNLDNSQGLPCLVATAWPRIDAGYIFDNLTLEGTVMNYEPTNATYNNDTPYTLSLPLGLSWTFTSSNLGPGLSLDASIYDKQMGSEQDYVWWRYASTDSFGRVSPTPNGMTFSPGLSFYTDPDNTWVLAQAQYWVLSSSDGNDYYWDWDYMNYAPLNE